MNKTFSTSLIFLLAILFAESAIYPGDGPNDLSVKLN